MIDNRIAELINCDLDGTISKSEKEELENALRENEEANGLYVKMTTLAEKLRAVEAVEPPPELKENIMGMLPDKQPQPVKRTSIIRDVFSQISDVPKLQLAGSFSFGFAAALVLMMVFIAPQRGNVVSPGETIGTIAINETGGRFIEIESKRVLLNDQTILLTTSRLGSALKLNISSQGDFIEQVRIQIGHEAVKFASFGLVAGTPSILEIKENQIQITADQAGSWEILFEDVPGVDGKLTIYVEDNHSSTSESISIK
jgi:hypothetical protein